MGVKRRKLEMLQRKIEKQFLNELGKEEEVFGFPVQGPFTEIRWKHKLSFRIFPAGWELDFRRLRPSAQVAGTPGSEVKGYAIVSDIKDFEQTSGDFSLT
jgi:hypothetical protein